MAIAKDTVWLLIKSPPNTFLRLIDPFDVHWPIGVDVDSYSAVTSRRDWLWVTAAADVCIWGKRVPGVFVAIPAMHFVSFIPESIGPTIGDITKCSTRPVTQQHFHGASNSLWYLTLGPHL